MMPILFSSLVKNGYWAVVAFVEIGAALAAGAAFTVAGVVGAAMPVVVAAACTGCAAAD